MRLLMEEEEDQRERERLRSTREGSPSDRGKASGEGVLDDVELFGIYAGAVTGIMDFGCFVQLEGFRAKKEGLVHISQIKRDERVTNVHQAVKKGQQVMSLTSARALHA